jgi:hypothetical protein
MLAVTIIKAQSCIFCSTPVATHLEISLCLMKRRYRKSEVLLRMDGNATYHLKIGNRNALIKHGSSE